MKILFAASEAAPFIKSGGLGDVMGALPPQLSKNPDAEVAVILPYYDKIKEAGFENIEFLTSFGMTLAWRNCHVGIFKAEIKKRGAGKRKGTKVTYYFVDNESYFCRGTLYGCEDDGERFAYFSKAVLEALQHIDFVPDIIHANDWQTGFLPLFLKAHYSHIDLYKNIKTVYTIHNIEYQGLANGDFLQDVLGVDEKYRIDATHDNMINAMKCAIVLCDKLTTVSETYANELSFSYFAHGLQDIISDNRYKTCGIVNGIDTDLYNSAKDEKIPHKFTAEKLAGKEKCKKALQKELGLPESDVPMFAMITRLVKHKGLELVEGVLENLAKMDIQLVIIGTGDKHFEEMFKHAAQAYPEKISANILFDAKMASKLYAAADFFLMPSKSEPCGLSQMIAMRYGTIPIVRETGGLFDTVKPVNTETSEGRGFTFKLFNAHDMLYAIERAADFYKDSEKMAKLRAGVMKIDFSWEEAGEKYLWLYREICQ